MTVLTPIPRNAAILVAAANAPAKVRARAHYRCNGSNDTSQIQNALDEIYDLGGGPVVLSSGTFYEDRAAGQIEVSGSTAILDGGNPNSKLTIGSDADNVEVGQLMRISGGDRSGNSLDDDGLESVYTVVSKTATEVYLGVQALGQWTNVSYHLQHHAIRIKEYCYLIGQGISSTFLALSTAAGGTYGCDGIHVQPSEISNMGFFKIEGMSLMGRNTSQTCEVGHSNGIVVARGSLDCVVRDVFPQSWKGAGLIDDHGWGFICDGNCVFEWNNVAGIVEQGGNATYINVKSITNDGPGIILRGNGKAKLSGCLLGGAQDNGGGYEVEIIGSVKNLFTGCITHAQSGTDGAFNFRKLGNRNAASYNLVRTAEINLASGAVAANFIESAAGNYLEGALNKAVASDPAVSDDGTEYANAWDFRDGGQTNYSGNSDDYRKIVQCKSTNGVTFAKGENVSWDAANGAGENVNVLGDVATGDPLYAGAVCLNHASGTYGPVVVEGDATVYCTALGSGDWSFVAGDWLSPAPSSLRSNCLRKASSGDLVVAKAREGLADGQSKILTNVLLLKHRFILP